MDGQRIDKPLSLLFVICSHWRMSETTNDVFRGQPEEKNNAFEELRQKYTIGTALRP